MKNFLKQNWFKVGLLAVLVISIASAFYWYQVKPANIRKECSRYLGEGFSGLGKSVTEKERNYQNCLRNYGLEK